MIIVLSIVFVLSLTAWAVFLSRPWWLGEESSLGLMSQQWISEQRADESRHRPT